ncbi:MAG: acyltransferase [Vampirovibrionales bacterium]|nr:acyltransferase [Vampirovibrionales bacterium]
MTTATEPTTLSRQEEYVQRYPDAKIHESAYVDAPCTLGEGTQVWHFSHILGHCTLGTGCKIGQNVVIGPRVTIGNNVKIQNNVSVYPGVTLEDDVFCGPSMVFTNVFNPRSAVVRNSDDAFLKTLVKRGASIGANATIVCGTTIGEYAFIGAGSVVTKDIPPYALVYGNPAKQHGWACVCGEPIKALTAGALVCPTCGQTTPVS